GTLKLDHLTGLSGAISGLAAGDIIDIADTPATTVFFDGSTLTINGQATTFQIASLPAGDTFAFKSDGATGTDLTVLPQTLSITSAPASGNEDTSIQLNFSDTVTGANLTSFVISGIPTGATLTDGNPQHSYTSGSPDGSVDVHSWNLSTLTVT